jgi:hypothetical protein
MSMIVHLTPINKPIKAIVWDGYNYDEIDTFFHGIDISYKGGSLYVVTGLSLIKYVPIGSMLYKIPNTPNGIMIVSPSQIGKEYKLEQDN